MGEKALRTEERGANIPKSESSVDHLSQTGDRTKGGAKGTSRRVVSASNFVLDLKIDHVNLQVSGEEGAEHVDKEDDEGRVPQAEAKCDRTQSTRREADSVGGQ